MIEYPDLTKAEEAFRAMLLAHEKATRSERAHDRAPATITPFRLWSAVVRAEWAASPEGKAAHARARR